MTGILMVLKGIIGFWCYEKLKRCYDLTMG